MVLRRSATSNLFNDKTEEDYIYNFGDYDGDFWLGNEAVLEMTTSKPYALMFDLTYTSGKKYVEYGGFSLYMNKNEYRIHLGVYTGGDLFGEYFDQRVYRVFTMLHVKVTCNHFAYFDDAFSTLIVQPTQCDFVRGVL